MKVFKGTPGEWTLYNHSIGESWIYSENNERIKGDVVCLSPDNELSESIKYWPANAALICAAPDLLEALQELVARVKIIGGCEDLIKQAEKAIAKALNILP